MTTTVLIKTKLQQPIVSQDIVSRPALHHRLDMGLQRKLTLVSAPAGYGKTTLVASWLNKSKYPNCWLSLDQGDNDLHLFVHYLVAAVRYCFPNACPNTFELLQSQKPQDVDTLASTLINDLVDLPDNLILVLDDYHAIAQADVIKLVHQLVNYMPQPLQLILITRHDPKFSIVGLRADRQLLEIRAKELRFSKQESRLFLQQALETDVTERIASIINEKIEGWIVGLRLAALSMRGRKNIDAIVDQFGASQTPFIVEYLLDEVMARTNSAVQEFLLKTSILDRFSAPLCDAVMDNEDPLVDSQIYIESLVKINLFIFALDDKHGWYRYHHLFQDLLRHRLAVQFPKQEIDELHCKASLWWEAEGYIDQALSHALLAGDISLAVAIVANQRVPELNRDDWRQLRRWLRNFSEEELTRHPVLLLTQAWIFHHQNRFADTIPLLEKAEKLLNDGNVDLSSKGQLTAEIAVLKAQVYIFQGRPAEGLALAQNALHNVDHGHYYIRSLGMLYAMHGLLMTGQGLAAEKLLEAELAQVLPDETYYKAYLFLSMNSLRALGGDLQKLRLMREFALKFVKTSGVHVATDLIQVGQGYVAYEWDELPDAARYFDEVCNRPLHVQPRIFLYGLVGSILVHQAKGERDIVQSQLDRLMDVVGGLGNSPNHVLMETILVHIHFLNGEWERPLTWARRTQLQPPVGIPFVVFIPHLVQAHILITAGNQADIRSAQSILELYLTYAETGHYRGLVVKTLVLQAMAAASLGENSQAMLQLAKAIALAQPDNLIRTFVDQGPDLAQLLALLAAQTPSSSEAAYIDRLLRAFPAKETAVLASKTNPLPEPLTDREIEILALLQQRLSNKEIAAQLFISPTTVKKHNEHIYQKLSVSSRKQAVQTALVLGILQPK